MRDVLETIFVVGAIIGFYLFYSHYPTLGAPIFYAAVVGLAAWFGYRGIMALSRWSDARSKQAPTSPEDSPDSVEEEPKGPWGPPAPVQPTQSEPAEHTSGDAVALLTVAPAAARTAIDIDDMPQEPPAPALPVAVESAPEQASSVAHGRYHPVYRAVRVALFLVSAGLLIASMNGIARSIDLMTQVGEYRFPDSDEAFEKTVFAQLALATATLDYDTIILQALAEEDIHRAEIYVSTAQRLGVALNPDTLARFEDETDTWSSITRWSGDALGGAWTGDVNNAGSLVGAVTSDLFVFGDVRDIGIQGSAYLNGQDYDGLIFGLSIVGLAATLEPSQTVNTGTAVLKGVSRSARVSRPLRHQLRRMVGETVDMGAVKAVLRNPTAEGASKIVRRQGMTKLRHVADQAATIYGTGGRRAVVMAMRHADSVDDLTLFARVSRLMGKQADEVIEIAGKHLKKVFRASKITIRTAVIVTGWLGALAAAVFGLVTSLSEMMARRIGTYRFLDWLAGYLTKGTA